jgi:predicted HicB family RNase H-like nuclease
MARPREFDGIVSVRLTKELHDQLAREAIRREKDLSDVIRERLARPGSVTQNATTPADAA